MIPFARLPLPILTLIVALLAAAAPIAAQTVTIETVALTGDDSLVAPGATFVGFDFPTINVRGDIAFRGSSSSVQGVYRRPAGGPLELIAHSGQTPPGVDGSFISFGVPVQNAAGDLAFIGFIAPPGGGFLSSLWVKPDGAPLRLVALSGETAPGTTDVFRSLSNPLLDSEGEVVFQAGLSTPQLTIWKTSFGVPQLLFRPGQIAPGTNNERFSAFSIPSMNPNGDLAVFAALENRDIGIWKQPKNESLQLVARTGAPAPGGGNFLSFSTFLMNTRGDLAFGALIDQPFPAGSGIWRLPSGGVLTEIIRGDDPALGGFGSLDLSWHNSDGSLGFTDSDFSDSIIYRMDSAGLISVVSRASELPPPPIPGAGPALLGPFAGNRAGDVAGLKAVMDLFFFDERTGIFLRSSDGSLFTLAGGDSLEVAPGDLRTVQDASTFGRGTEVAGPTILTDGGRLVFEVFFDDFSQGIFTASFGGPAVTVADSYATDEDTPLSVPAATGVLANDSDPDGEALSAVLVDGPARGALTLNADGSFSYIPDPDFFGTDGFTYNANDGSSDSAATSVTLTVNPVNDAPVANAGVNQTSNCTSPDATLVTLDASGTIDVDDDAATLSYQWTGPFGTVSGINPQVALPVGPSEITLSVSDGALGDSDTVLVNVLVEVFGLQAPLPTLVLEGGVAAAPDKAFKQGRSLPLKLRLFCDDGQALAVGNVPSVPQIAGLTRTGEPLDLQLLDLDSGLANDDGLAFRFSETDQLWIYNLSTTALATGSYQIVLAMPDARRYLGALVLR